MFRTIYIPVDNSEHSNRAVDLGIELGRAAKAKMVGCHVYAAKMHDYRFKQMEYTLPEEYLEETELNRQRKIHDSLITMGLKLISDSYLNPMEAKCREAELEFEPRMIDGKHADEIVKDIAKTEYDLLVIGALGLGRVRDSQVGSVCERVTRRADTTDVLVVKHVPKADEPERKTILVGVDGSPQSFGALQTAIDLAEKFGKEVEAVSVYDPYLHYSVFNGIVDVLSEKAAKVFRFEEQNQLHEEIIDTGLAQIYQSHLDVAEKMASERGVTIKKTLLDGKAFQKVLNHARKTNPWMVVIGRIGIHASEGETGLGSNAENLFRSLDCDLLLTTRTDIPELDVRAEETIRWTPEAESRMERVPAMVVGIARTAIFRLAVEKGHSVITSDLLDEAMDRFMPKGAKATTKLAEALVVETTRGRNVAMCKRCGVSSTEPDPAKCSVCGGQSFQIVTPEMIEEIVKAEGGREEETTYDGRKLTWTRDAKRGLWSIRDGYKRRRTKARIEKAARMRRLPTVTVEFAREPIEEELGEPLVLVDGDSVPVEESTDAAAIADGRKLVARDSKNVPLLSAFGWTPEGVERMLRVPAGFMRDRTQARVEELAAETKVATIDLDTVEEGIALGRQMMEQMITAYEKNPKETREAFDERTSTPRSDEDETEGEPERRFALNEVGSIPSVQAKSRE